MAYTPATRVEYGDVGVGAVREDDPEAVSRPRDADAAVARDRGDDALLAVASESQAVPPWDRDRPRPQDHLARR